MESPAYLLFDTALGRCGLAWGPDGILASSFPYDTDAHTRTQLKRRAPNIEETTTPPHTITCIIDEIKLLFTKGVCNFSDCRFDMSGVSEFDRALYRLTLQIAPGETRTYGDLAKALGDVSLSRRVGQSLGRNPFPIIVPCHRVVGANGAMTGFSAPGGTDTKRQLLKIEGAFAPDLFD